MKNLYFGPELDSAEVMAIDFHFLLQSKEEVMAVRLREADSMAAVAEMRQRIAELEIQVRSPGEELAIHLLTHICILFWEG